MCRIWADKCAACLSFDCGRCKLGREDRTDMGTNVVSHLTNR